MPPTYENIRNAFSDFFDTYVQPTATRSLRCAEVYSPILASSNTNFRITACNPTVLKNLLEVVRDNRVWIPLRLHELIYLQLQFFPIKSY